MNTEISEFLKSVMTKDFETAKSIFNSIMSTKTLETIDSYRQEVGETFFNSAEEIVDETN